MASQQFSILPSHIHFFLHPVQRIPTMGNSWSSSISYRSIFNKWSFYASETMSRWWGSIIFVLLSFQSFGEISGWHLDNGWWLPPEFSPPTKIAAKGKGLEILLECGGRRGVAGGEEEDGGRGDGHCPLDRKTKEGEEEEEDNKKKGL